MTQLPEDIEALVGSIEMADAVFDSIDMANLISLRDCLDDPLLGPIVKKRLLQSDRKRQAMFEFIGLSSPKVDAKPQQKLLDNQVDASLQASVLTDPKVRRPASKGFDYTIFRAVAEKRKQRPVSQADLFALLKMYQPITKKGSLTTKLNRMKDQDYLAWAVADDIKLTDPGRARMEELARYLSDRDVEAISEAFANAWDMQVSVR